VKAQEGRRYASKGTGWPAFFLPIDSGTSASRRPLEAHLSRAVGQQDAKEQQAA
jgi:hypothetical protein